MFFFKYDFRINNLIRERIVLPCPQFIVEVRTSLTGKLAMKNQDVPLDAAVGVVVGDSGERVWREEGRNELLVLAVLPVLRTLDVPTGELEGIANIDYPEQFSVIL